MNLQIKGKTGFLRSLNINTQIFRLLWLTLLPLLNVLDIKQIQAQQIVPAVDGTGTMIAPNGNQIDITGGQISGDQVNLFHSFAQFGLNSEQIANFLSTPGIENILGRVVGGEPSIINGQIQVTGSNANLFLMNPSGFVFGSNASLNVPGSFSATTANGIGFGSNWFSAGGVNNYAALVGNPDAVSFSMSQPGGIINFGNLGVGNGQSLTLSAGSIVNTGTLSAPGGRIIVSAVAGERLVRLSQSGSILSLEIQPLSASINQAQPWNLPILSLPQLLTSGGGGNADKLFINSEGKVALSGSGISVENGDNFNGNINTSFASIETTSVILPDADGIARQNLDNRIVLSDRTAVILTTTSGNLTVGNIDTSGGGVILNSGGNVTFDSINTQGRSFYGETARGGDVNIIANGVVRGAGVIPVGESGDIPANTTILARGTTPGNVTIQHNGGNNNAAFIIGDSTINGTVGAIDTEVTARISSGTFPVLANGGDVSAAANVTITSVNRPPTLTINPLFNSVKQDNNITLSYGDLRPTISDADQDNTFLRIEAIAVGTLKKNGAIALAGTVFAPGDALEYTPPVGFSGRVNAFSISAGDGVSFSPPQTISFDVTATPSIPPIDPTPLTPPIPKTDPTPSIPPINPTPLTPIPLDKTNSIQQTPSSVVTPPLAVVDINQPSAIDPGIAVTDDKFASQFESYFRTSAGNNQVRERRRITLYETRDILRQIEKATGVKPAIIYVNFIPSGAEGKASQVPQDNDQLELLLVTGKEDPIRKTISAAKRKDVLEIAEELYGTVETPNNQNYRLPAAELYQLMIAPLKQELDKRGINNLLFIADEGLRSLPFAALYDGKQFLIENYSVGFTPALSITDTRYVDIRNSQILAMGASKFEKLKPLPAVPEELSIVAEEIWEGKFFVNQNFTLNNFKSLRKNQPYGIIHLATHGNFEKGEPANSFIQFWDNQLRLPQVGDLGLNNPAVELLVLSACRTALGDRNAELGFGGIAYATGVKTSVASLWKVSDAGTLGFMVEFYKNLKTAPIKAEALRRAQVAMLKGQVVLDNGLLRTSVRGINLPTASPDAKLQQDLRHPFYWSAFTMIGNPW
ncbi:CHAT domain-containing protein [Fortiea contorta]|uniref:CHAT domain-containing protein n=1 Tax=Fortiea contorta TaxID=1892405 RepID=UPI00034721CC|nr:CHAT domain-containing protein [Fortiea contorta]